MAVSFAKVGAATAPVTVTPEVVDSTAPVGTASTQAPAVIPPKQGFVSRFNTGTEEDAPEETNESPRIRHPYLNLVQNTSGDEMKKVAPVGQFALAQSILIPSGSRIVVIGFGPTFYREKVKHGGKDKGRTAYSLEEVAKYGGTREWSESQEKRGNGSVKPWFQPAITAALLIEKPEAADDDFFPHVIGGKAYALAKFEAKSIAYDSFYVDLNSKRKTTALFKAGWAGRFLALNSVKGKGEDASSHPTVTVLEPTPPEFVELAKKLAATI